jgi:hypothetical protein
MKVDIGLVKKKGKGKKKNTKQETDVPERSISEISES